MIDHEKERHRERDRQIAKTRSETDELLSAAMWKLATEFAHAGLPPTGRANEIAAEWFKVARKALKLARSEADATMRELDEAEPVPEPEPPEPAELRRRARAEAKEARSGR